MNSAFTGIFAPFTAIAPDEFRRVTEVTYLGCMHGTQAALRRMIGGLHAGLPRHPPAVGYCGAKHAIQGWNESLRSAALRLPGAYADGATAGARHPAVRLGTQPAATPGPARAADLPAGGGCRAIVHAADHPRRREYWVGGTTAATLLANAVAPGLLDRYLARTGFSSQQTAEERDPGAPMNLWSPADGPEGHDFGAHGRFGGAGTLAERSVVGLASPHGRGGRGSGRRGRRGGRARPPRCLTEWVAARPTSSAVVRRRSAPRRPTPRARGR